MTEAAANVISEEEVRIYYILMQYCKENKIL